LKDERNSGVARNVNQMASPPFLSRPFFFFSFTLASPFLLPLEKGPPSDVLAPKNHSKEWFNTYFTVADG